MPETTFFCRKYSVGTLQNNEEYAIFSVWEYTMNTRTLETVESDIARVQKELSCVRGTETEVYARIVGYYRSVRNWNKGKKDEFLLRTEFNVDEGSYTVTDADCESGCCSTERVQPNEAAFNKVSGTVIRYVFYSRKTCPNCPPVRDYLSRCSIPGTAIDVDTPDGLALAQENGVQAAPTVIMYNAAGNEVIRVHNKTELASVIACEAIAV
jgi:ribonucleoside-triphosphate reductase